MWKWIVGVSVGLFVVMMVIGTAHNNTPERQRKLAEEAKQECVHAIASNMGTSTSGYADRKAYNDHVREKCKGFNMPNLTP